MKIFLDDERSPPDSMLPCHIIRTYKTFTCLVDAPGVKFEFISFDHDLGEERTGLDCAKYLVEADMDRGVLSDEFWFYVHSMNPVGGANITQYLTSYLKQRGKL